ncbi:iron ABC transporter permease [Halogeometricum borinquense]|uniref:Iron ABC transporter permease n=1 Tax=Halogeometricum borinquense TaxID=60847 RepID=A0A6C0UGL2_9EURY|nr:iron ABC transporter permease [Halogeometricum borinquense]QIB74674.1 iron ABC transporter permease [Halogeometricum borinquense]QIQ76373.1 iron ABC transporter permease [Halogeometricum borinquense]
MATEQRTATDDRGPDEGTDAPLGLTIASGAVAAAVVLPLLWLVKSSLEVGLSEALSLLTRPTTLDVFVNSTILVTLTTAACILLGVPLAYLTVRTDLPFRRFWTVAVSLPLVIPSYIGAFAFVSAFGPRGDFQRLLAPLGVEQLPEIYGLQGTVLVLTLYTYPYVYITARASLKSMDTTLIDAARTLEHGRWEAFKRVTVPQIRPAVAAGSLLAGLYVLSDFGTPSIMRYDVFTRVIYVEFGAFGRDTATLLSLQLVGVTFIILWLESRVRGEERTSGGGRSRDVVPLGVWKLPAMVFCAAVAGLALVVPLGILVTWLGTSNAAVNQSLAFEWQYVFNSISVSTGAALVAIVAGLPVAYLSARHSNRLSPLFERATYVGYAVPGVVLGLALVYFGSSVGAPVYPSLYLLVFAYVIRFLPQAVGSLRASFLRVDPSLPEAARTLGRTSIGAFRHVTLPLVAPGLFGGAALVFLTTMKELPATLLLRPSGFKTLVTHIWTAYESGYFGQAAIPALVLLFVSGLSMLVIITQEGYDVK